MADVNATCLTLAKISETSAELSGLQTRFNKSVKSHAWTELAEVYESMSQATGHWGAHR